MGQCDQIVVVARDDDDVPRIELNSAYFIAAVAGLNRKKAADRDEGRAGVVVAFPRQDDQVIADVYVALGLGQIAHRYAVAPVAGIDDGRPSDISAHPHRVVAVAHIHDQVAGHQEPARDLLLRH